MAFAAASGLSRSSPAALASSSATHAVHMFPRAALAAFQRAFSTTATGSQALHPARPVARVASRAAGRVVAAAAEAVAPAAAGLAAPPLSFAARHGLQDAQGRLMLKNLTLPELSEWCESVGKRR